ncbi:hypothetical protein Egran_05546 [Elaphomyces granulatus]|uniref:Ketoreductase (KR) domain-containing protein n=1 Tax=Elaphomyces granulatus TaxID=519963 RepID=A0A232LS99_9EURO|nr:hypothetical protein Egran_05546 [Elaphomyces granulatus]
MASPLQLKYLTKLSGARVLILGGTSDIGFAVASAALEHGAKVIIAGSRMHRFEGALRLDRTLTRLKEAYPDPSYHRRLSGYACDLGVPEKLEENLSSLFKQVTTAAPQSSLIDHIIFAAGDSPEITDVTVDSVPSLSSLPLILAKLAPKHMKRISNSSITLTSVSQLGLTRDLALELKPIRVNCVAPGAIHTELLDNIPPEQLQSIHENMSKDTVLGQVGNPVDVAEAYIYSMKDGFSTGSSIHSDGGRLLE